MNYAAIFKGRARALIMDFSSLTVILIVIIACVYAAKTEDVKSTSELPVAVVNLDEGELGEKLVDILLAEDAYTFYLTTEEDGMKAIARSKAQGMVIIRPDFTKKIMAEDIDSLVDVTVMSDTYEFVNFTEFVINDATKVWLEMYGENQLRQFSDVDEKDIETFHEETTEVWNGDSLIHIVPHLLGENTDTEKEEEKSYSGIRWYAALSLFYLMLSGIWMCDYGSGHFLKRALGKNANIAFLFFVQSLPGLCITTIGMIPVLIAENTKQNPLLILIAYIIYVIGASGMALVFCSLAGKLSNLVLVAPVVSMAASLMSGLLCKLPDWAGFWEVASLIFPGRWFYRAAYGQPFLIGSVLIAAGWFAAGLLVSWVLSVIKKK